MLQKILGKPLQTKKNKINRPAESKSNRQPRLIIIISGNDGHQQEWVGILEGKHRDTWTVKVYVVVIVAIIVQLWHTGPFGYKRFSLLFFLGHPTPICSGWWSVMSWQYNEMSRNEKQGQKVLNTILKKTSKTSQAAVGVPKLLSADVLRVLVMYSYE